MYTIKYPKGFFIFLLIFLLKSSISSSADTKEGSFDMGEMIMHHILDDYQYEIVHGFAIPLPIIIYSEDKGFTIFSSSKLFDEDHVPLEEGYNGFKYYHGKLKPIDDNLSYVDLSITKNVFFLIMTASLMIIVFLIVARSYSYKNEAPKGLSLIHI